MRAWLGCRCSASAGHTLVVSAMYCLRFCFTSGGPPNSRSPTACRALFARLQASRRAPTAATWMRSRRQRRRRPSRGGGSPACSAPWLPPGQLARRPASQPTAPGLPSPLPAPASFGMSTPWCRPHIWCRPHVPARQAHCACLRRPRRLRPSPSTGCRWRLLCLHLRQATSWPLQLFFVFPVPLVCAVNIFARSWPGGP